MAKIEEIKDFAKDRADDAIDKALVVKNSVEEGSGKVVQFAQDRKYSFDLKMHNPFSAEQFMEPNFEVYPMIRIYDSNPHKDKAACADAIGFKNVIAKEKVMDLIKPKIPEGKLKFYPNMNEMLYYRNPYIEDFYIGLNEYFAYIKKERVNELVNIANKLGAKYVKITFKEEQKKFVSVSGNAKGKEKKKGVNVQVNTNADVQNNKLAEIEVASEMKFKGHSFPEKPELIYYKHDTDIENLINMCIEKPDSVISKSYTLKYNRSSDMDINAAMKVDAVLGKLGIGATASFKSEVEKENRLFLEYEIEF